MSLNKKNNVHRLQKKALTSSEIVTKVKEKVLSLAQRAFADKINWYIKRVSSEITFGRRWKKFSMVEKKKTKFTILSKINRYYLAMQASSVLSERGFSSRGFRVTDMRSRLHPMTVRSVMCLKSLFKLGLNWIDS